MNRRDFIGSSLGTILAAGSTASGLEGAAPLLSLFFLASFLHLSLHRIARGCGGFSAASLRAHLLPLALYLALGAAFLAEVALDRAETAAWVRALLAHGGALRAGIALALAGAILSSALLLRGVRRGLGGEGR